MPSEEQHVIWERRQAELWDRIFQVTQDVVTLAEVWGDTMNADVIRKELMTAAMNVGRNVVRATASDEAGDFRKYLMEAKMSAVETDYWLRMAYMVQQQEEVQQDLSSVINQYSAIIDLFHKMLRHVKGEADVVTRHSRGPRVS